MDYKEIENGMIAKNEKVEQYKPVKIIKAEYEVKVAINEINESAANYILGKISFKNLSISIIKAVSDILYLAEPSKYIFKGVRKDFPIGYVKENKDRYTSFLAETIDSYNTGLIDMSTLITYLKILGDIGFEISANS